MLKKIVFLIAIAITSFSCNSQSKEGISVLSPTNFEKKLSNDVQLIDVRTVEEFENGHLKNATNYSISNANFETQLATLDKTKPVCVYCKRGGRSAKAAAQLKAMGFTTIYDLDGGFDAWVDSGKEMEK